MGPVGGGDAASNAMPPGNSAVEVAARRGFGPLSPAAEQVWHGDSKPCVSCGQLVRRAAISCDACGEDLSDGMVMKMRAYAGPWYVLEHVRPFPGVTFERLVRQVRRGVLTRWTIVRGPATDHQWRYAGETPGLCKHLGVCWNCQAAVTVDDSVCPACQAELGSLSDLPGHGTIDDLRVTAGVASAPAASAALCALATAAGEIPESRGLEEEGAQIGVVKVWWIVVAMLLVVVAVLFAVVKVRDANTQAERDVTTSHVRSAMGCADPDAPVRCFAHGWSSVDVEGIAVAM